MAQRAAKLGDRFLAGIASLTGGFVREARRPGLRIGIELTPEAGPARAWCKRLMHDGLLCKDTVERVMRIAPPLVIEEPDLEWAFERIACALRGEKP